MAVAVVERFRQESIYGLSPGTKKVAVAVVERFRQESIYGLSPGTKKVAVFERWSLVEVRLKLHLLKEDQTIKGLVKF